MKEKKLEKRVLLVCCNRRERGGIPSCGAKGVEVFLGLQALLDRGAPEGTFLVVPSGCLGFCAHGPVTVADPAARRAWTGVDPADLEGLAGEILGTCAGGEEGGRGEGGPGRRPFP